MAPVAPLMFKLFNGNRIFFISNGILSQSIRTSPVNAIISRVSAYTSSSTQREKGEQAHTHPQLRWHIHFAADVRVCAYLSASWYNVL